LDALNAQPLAQAQQAGLTPATRGAQDGTLVAANASRHRLLNEATLDQRVQQLDQALAADAAQHEPPAPPHWMAKRPAGRRHARHPVAQARGPLQQALARNAAKRASKRQQAERVVVSVADPEAALGRDKEHVYRPLYNVQVVADLDSPFGLGYAVFAQPNDPGLLGAVQARVRPLLGHPLEVLLADPAYANRPDLAAAAAAGITVYAPLPQEPRPGKYLPKSAFRWDAATRSYVCPQGQRLAYERTVPQKQSGPEAVPLHRYRCPAEHCRTCPLAA